MLSAALVTLAIAAPQAPTLPAVMDRSVVPHGAVSTDPNYGVTPGTPVQVGGGSMYGPAREHMSAPPLPSGVTASDAPVWLQTLIDRDGMPQHPAYIGGPAHLAQAAIEAVQRWRSEPARINGAPIVRPVMIPVRFKQ